MYANARSFSSLVGQKIGWGVGALALIVILCAGFAQGASAKAYDPSPAEQAKAEDLGYSLEPSKTLPYQACQGPDESHARVECFVLKEPNPQKTAAGRFKHPAGPYLEGSGQKGGWSPKDLQEAYGIPTSGGEGMTVAVVNAWSAPMAESDMAKYREEYGLPPCTTANGCFKKVNVFGEEGNYPVSEDPKEELGWQVETSLDLDMVSAACPKCNILLVEGTSEVASLSLGVKNAVKFGADVVSNSYGLPEGECVPAEDGPGCSDFLTYYDQPVPVTVSAGNSGHAMGVNSPSFPATSPDVIAVGGSELAKAETERGWSDKVWPFSSSGCSAFHSKPAWQTDQGCENRMGNDVSIVAEAVSIYSTPGFNGWGNIGGTSAGAPLLAGILAQAPQSVREQGAEAFYRHELIDVVAGTNNVVGSPCGGTYFCRSEVGYDGPSGWGVPDGLSEQPLSLRVATSSASEKSGIGATLNGYVASGGLATTYRFEYGPTEAYGSSVPAVEASAGSGATWKSVSQSVSNLMPGTYHYRLVATNGSGTAYGKDRTFDLSPWAQQSVPPIPPLGAYDGELADVSCATVDACVAVGSHAMNTVNGPVRQAVIRRWDGTEWQSETAPTPAGTTFATLEGVSCSAAGTCTAVGSYTATEGAKALILRLAGGSWSIQTLSTFFSSSELNGVSCPTSTFCVAVGSNQGLTRVLYWNGASWTGSPSGPTPAAATSVELQDVSCTATNACTAVGYYFAQKPLRFMTFVIRWNGEFWQTQTSVDPPGKVLVKEKWETVNRDFLEGVSCAGKQCVAVGKYTNEEGDEVSLAEVWNGTTWSLQTLPSFSNWNSLAEVSCWTNLCTAVGRVGFDSEGNGGAIAFTFSSSTWTPVKLPITPTEYGAKLHAISCVMANACTAVGEDGPNLLVESALAPGLSSVALSAIGEKSATIKGYVYPNGESTTYRFEYGTTTAYGTKAPLPDANAGSGAEAVTVKQELTGLTPKTLYHYRLVATNKYGVTVSEDMTFKTS